MSATLDIREIFLAEEIGRSLLPCCGKSGKLPQLYVLREYIFIERRRLRITQGMYPDRLHIRKKGVLIIKNYSMR